MRWSSSRKFSTVFSVPPIDEPRAMPAGPKRRINTHDSSPDTTSDAMAMRTGVRVSRSA